MIHPFEPLGEQRDQRGQRERRLNPGSELAAPPASHRKRKGRTASIIGTVGLPAQYGGFETLAEQLVRAAEARGISRQLSVWCSSAQGRGKPARRYRGARLHSLPIAANGAASIAFDALSGARELLLPGGADTVLALGVSGAAPLTALRPLTNRRLIFNVDGREADRAKWGRLAQRVLSQSLSRAVAHADEIVADNAALAQELRERYACSPRVIAYGGDHAQAAPRADIADLKLPRHYALTVARAEPENNLETLFKAFARMPSLPLVVVANWSRTSCGRRLRAAWDGVPGLRLIEAEYLPGRLHAIRAGAWLYVHGHSAGGTNPSLVEMMGFGVPLLTWDCAYNRTTSAGLAPCFSSSHELADLVRRYASRPDLCAALGATMRSVARHRYRWDDIAEAYFDLLDL